MAQEMEKSKNPMKTKLPYRLDDKLFFRNASGEDTFCLCKSMCSGIFQLVNDQQALQGLTFSKGTKLPKKYIQHCPTCRDNAVLRHKLYGSLQPILTPLTPFRTTTLEFVVGLPTTVKGHNAMLNLTDKFT
ncbi:hypothetical protein N7467_004990 [Penicillium canescens]|nr:hypothetical protein N7467_004990 [Penicillium canescens]